MELKELNKKKLGFGLMRLPKDEKGNIDLSTTKKMADRFLSEGFTYFDTAYVYEGSEEAFGKAIRPYHDRNSYTIASKLSGWALSESFTPEMMFAEQLKRTGLDYFDFYLLHNVKPENIEAYDKYDAWGFCRKLREEGKIRHFGLSSHAKPEFLDEILTKHPEIEFVQLQINYLDWTSAKVQAREMYETARKHGKEIIIMEPVKGGLLSNLSQEITEPFSSGSPASYALRYAASLDGVFTVLSGMSTPEQMEDNMGTFSPLKDLTDQEKKAIATVKEKIESLQVIQCTSCRYCTTGCPKHIQIPDIFAQLNEFAVIKNKEKPKKDYQKMVEEGKSGRASECIRCGKCEAVCPQKLPIRELLKGAEEKLC